MAKDFKTRQPERKGSGLLLGLFVGFLLGLGVAAGIAVYVFKTPMPFANKTATPAKPGEKGGLAGYLQDTTRLRRRPTELVLRIRMV